MTRKKELMTLFIIHIVTLSEKIRGGIRDEWLEKFGYLVLFFIHLFVCFILLLTFQALFKIGGLLFAEFFGGDTKFYTYRKKYVDVIICFVLEEYHNYLFG